MKEQRLFLHWAGITDKSSQREENEDAFLAGNFLGRAHDRCSCSGQLADQEAPIFAVADGLGGHEDGEIASRYALSFLNYEAAHFSQEGKTILWQLYQAYLNIHMKLSALGSGSFYPMGTTLTSVFFSDHWGFVAHVGDTQLWKFTKEPHIGEKLTLLTSNHNREKETAIKADRHILTSFLGGGIKLPYIDVFAFPFADGDFFLLNSDGLVEALTSDLIKEIISNSHNTLMQKAVALVAHALKDPLDNTTALLVQSRFIDRIE